MDLVRKLVSTVEASDRLVDSSTIRLAGYSGETITEHVRLLTEAGLAEGIQAYCAEHKLKWIALRLTWRGHDFLDAARDDTVWTETVTTMRRKTGGVPFEALKELLVESVRNMVVC